MAPAPRQRVLQRPGQRHLPVDPERVPARPPRLRRPRLPRLDRIGRQFYLGQQWRAGWDVVGVTDKWFLDNYRIRNQTISTDYFREAVSTAFLIGQGDRSWFEARGYYFKGLSTFDWQKQQPVVAPVIDYDKRRDGPDPIGGEVRIQANFQHLTRDATQYTQIPRTSTTTS